MTVIVGRLPESAFTSIPPYPFDDNVPHFPLKFPASDILSTKAVIDVKKSAWQMTIKEIVESERKYVQALETTQVPPFPTY